MRRLSLLFAGLCLLTWASAGRAQEGKYLGVATEIESKFKEPARQRAFNELLYGNRAPQKADADLIDLASKYYVYRVTWPKVVKEPAEMKKAVNDYEDLVTRLVGAKKSDEFRRQLGKQLAARLKEVFDIGLAENRLAVANAAQMLPPLARIKDEDVGDLFTNLVTDPKTHDVVKLFALKGMGEFFPPRTPGEFDDPKDAKLNQKRARDVKRVNALLATLERKWDPAQVDPAAAVYIRREAVRGLAEVQVPAVVLTKNKKGQLTGVEAPGVVGLLKVLANDGIDPPATLAERLEAGLGVCQIRASAFPDYQPDLGFYLTGKAIADFVDRYRGDYVNVIQKDAAQKLPPYLPYKYYAQRYEQALDTLVKNTKGTAAQAKAEQLQSQAKPFLTNIGRYYAVNDGTAAFRQFLETPAFRPKTGEVFKGLAEPKIELAGAKAKAGG